MKPLQEGGGKILNDAVNGMRGRSGKSLVKPTRDLRPISSGKEVAISAFRLGLCSVLLPIVLLGFSLILLPLMHILLRHIDNKRFVKADGKFTLNVAEAFPISTLSDALKFCKKHRLQNIEVVAMSKTSGQINVLLPVGEVN